MRAQSPSITIRWVACLTLLAMAPVSWAARRSKYRVRAVRAIPLQLAQQNRSDPVEASKLGTLLLFPWGLTKIRAHVESRKARRLEYRKLVEQMKTLGHFVQEPRVVPQPRLLVWDYQRQQAAFEFPKNDEWASWENKAEGIRGDWQFRFQGDGSRIVGIQTPWLVLIDVQKQAEIARALPSESYLRKGSPGQPSAWAGVRICHLGIDPLSGSVAAAYNTGKETHLYVYDRDLKTQIGSWPLPRMVKDICWSPDGKRLAVLFHGRFDENRELHFVDNHFTDTLPGPDVWVMDPRSGEPLLKFRTGTAQDQIAFGRDGSSIYVINDYLYGARGGVIGAFSPDHRGAVRVFSAASGALVHTLTGGPKGVHSGFCLSPDGSLIAADASTEFMSFRMMETAPGEKIARVVVLDAKTGHLLFEHHEKTNGYISDPLGLDFSPDGRLLFVDLPGSYMKPQRIQVYSIEDVSGPKHRR